MRRPLCLHYSALSPDEFPPFKRWLRELLPPAAGSPTANDEEGAALDETARVDDVGRLLLERLQVPEEVWEDILASFHPSHRTIEPRYSTQSHLRALPPLTAAQVLVILRLVAHASAGRDTRTEGVDLAFRQASPPADLVQAPSPSLFDEYLAKKHAKPPPPPQHVQRRASTNQKATTRASPAIGGVTPPPSPPPPRRASARQLPPPVSRPPHAAREPAAVDLFSDSPQGMTFSDAEYLHKVADDGVSSSSDSSSDENEQEPATGRQPLWQTAAARGDRTTPRRSETYPASMGRSPAFDSQQAPFQAADDSRSVSGASFNPFRSRLQSVPSSAVAGMLSPELYRTLSDGQDPASPISPPLPPRPASGSTAKTMSSATAPPLPARDQASRQSFPQSSSSSSSGSLSHPIRSLAPGRPAPPLVPQPKKQRAPPPSRPPKPAAFPDKVASAFKTTALIHQSLAAAEDARHQAVHAPDKERRFEVIGSSSPTKERGPARAAVKTHHSGGRDSSAGGSSGSKWGTVNASIGFGKPQTAIGGSKQRPAVGSHTFGRSTSQATTASSSAASSPAHVFADPAAEYPFPLSRRLSSFEGAPPPPPPPLRRNSSTNKPTYPSSRPSSGVSRHASLSSRLSSGFRPEDHLRGTFEHSVRAFGQVAEGGADLFRQSRNTLPAAAASWGIKGKGDRERLMEDSNSGAFSREMSDGERDSADESRRAMRRDLARAEGVSGYSPL